MQPLLVAPGAGLDLTAVPLLVYALLAAQPTLAGVMVGNAGALLVWRLVGGAGLRGPYITNLAWVPVAVGSLALSVRLLGT